MARAELFCKDAQSLIATAQAMYAYGARGVNLPNKSPFNKDVDLAPTPALRTLAGALTADQLARYVPHYSLKFNSSGRDHAATKKRFESFLQEAAKHGVRDCLLISGSGSREFDTIACLRDLTVPPDQRPSIGVAFNPYLPQEVDRERERSRLRDKVRTGRVGSVWIQIGSDTSLLQEGMAFIKDSCHPEGNKSIQLYGSVFMPSKKLVAQMKFRPWNGVFLGEEYLSSVQCAITVTRNVLGIYKAYGVEPLLESPLVSREQFLDAVTHLGLAGSGTPSPRQAPSQGRGPGQPSETLRAMAEKLCVSIVWFRHFDLRVADHGPLSDAAQAAQPAGAVVPVFVWPQVRGEWAPGGAAQAWLRSSLKCLSDSLCRLYSSRLVLRLAHPEPPEPARAANCSHVRQHVPEALALARQAALKVPPRPGANGSELESEAVCTAAEIVAVAWQAGAGTVRWTASYEPESARVEEIVEVALGLAGIQSCISHGYLLYHPAPASLLQPSEWPASVCVDDLGLAPVPRRADGTAGEDWAALLMAGWNASEEAAEALMSQFLGGVKAGAAAGTSGLSRWFHDTLLDADLAINSMMWQNAGRSGIDQWNFVLSPENGSQDPSGNYVRKWSAGVVLGQNYPHRVVVDLQAARKVTVAWLLEARATSQERNDPGGYDLISLPDGSTTRVFTKEEFRIDSKGNVKGRVAGSAGTRRGSSNSKEKKGKHMPGKSALLPFDKVDKISNYVTVTKLNRLDDDAASCVLPSSVCTTAQGKAVSRNKVANVSSGPKKPAKKRSRLQTGGLVP
eukprot:gene12089-2204_t